MKMIIIKQVFTNSTKTIAMHKNGALNKTKTNLAILREQQYKLITVIMQFSGRLLTLKLNSTSAYYEASINTNTTQKHYKYIKNTKQTKQKHNGREQTT